MPDIAMCKSQGCELKFGCYRFKAIPNDPYQSYFTNPPFETNEGVQTCGYFWPTEEYLKIEKNAGKDSRGEVV